MKFLLVDNFDSFTYNIVHYLEKLNILVEVETNLSVDLSLLTTYDAVVLSPGPGLPKQAGKLMDVIAVCDLHQVPILGVCLGMQALAEHDGSTLYNQQQVKHGVSELINVSNENSMLFDGLPKTFSVGLYHSWAVKLKENSKFEATAYSLNDTLMAIENSHANQFAVQFHPESVLSEYGEKIFQNFINGVAKRHKNC
jgi:anthranilate synthase component 2